MTWPAPETCEFEGLWGGQIERYGRAISFAVAGLESGPHSMLVDPLLAVIDRLPEVEQAALEFICGQEPGLYLKDFTLYDMDFLWEQHSDAFALEFTLAGDVDGIWRVEFERGQPKCVCRDD